MDEQKVVGGVDVPTGEKLILAASFDKDRQDAPGVATGMLSLFHSDTKVGEGRIKTQPGKFSLAGKDCVSAATTVSLSPAITPARSRTGSPEARSTGLRLT